MVNWYRLDKGTEESVIKSLQIVMLRVYGLLLSDKDARYILSETERGIYDYCLDGTPTGE